MISFVTRQLSLTDCYNRHVESDLCWPQLDLYWPRIAFAGNSEAQDSTRSVDVIGVVATATNDDVTKSSRRRRRSHVMSTGVRSRDNERRDNRRTLAAAAAAAAALWRRRKTRRWRQNRHPQRATIARRIDPDAVVLRLPSAAPPTTGQTAVVNRHRFTTEPTVSLAWSSS